MGEHDCAQDGGVGISWHSQGHKRRLWAGGKREVGTRVKQPAREGFSLCVLTPPPGCLLPSFPGGQTMVHLPCLHFFFLPGLSVQGKAANTARKGTPATAALSPAELREGGEEVPLEVSPEGGAPQAACEGSPGWLVLLLGLLEP